MIIIVLFSFIVYSWNFRVLGLKLLPPLIIFLFIPPFSLIFFFGILILFAEDYLGRIVYAGTKLVLLLLWKVPWIAIQSYSLLSVWSSLLVSIKSFLTVSMIVGNFIDVYLFGMIAVLISVLLYLSLYGLIMGSFILFLFLSSLSSFLFILCLLESFSSFFQSLTLSNRLSINMLCGSLLTSLLSLFLFICGIKSSITSMIILMLLLIVFSFEILNSSIQLFIFMVLSFEYLMILIS
jgi:hypothetical protein